ncbi:amidohydrolase family protein [Solicola sp. PLA-1-18]|uniref:amidohydrolase family protein n=1 Tax=Solicola sp. PLA-1-18 TaxID=3380532 RepID=UPI003B788EBA
MQDRDLPDWAAHLGVPGLFDVHVHFLPPPILRKVWAYFDAAGPLIGRPWTITYRWSDDERVAHLHAMGVRHYSALPYAHKPGIAGYLNDWAAEFADAHPESLRSATFYPEPGAGEYVAEAVERGVEVFKAHVQVGQFAPDDPLLDPVWDVLTQTGRPVVLHAGSGPAPGRFTGVDGVRQVLRRFPRLPLVVAHMGTPEYEEFLELAEQHERVHLDTTMVFTDFTEESAPYPRHLLPRLVALQDKVLLGSDFPNIPYTYAHQVEALQRTGLGDDWLRDVCWHNGVRLFPGRG